MRVEAARRRRGRRGAADACGGGACVAWERFLGLLQQEPAQARRLLALAPEPERRLLRAAPRAGVRDCGVCARHVRRLLHRGRERRARGEHGPVVLAHWDDPLRLGAPGGDRALRLGGLAEDEPEQDVDAAESEEEERGDECEVVDVMGEDLGRDEALEDAQRTEAELCAKHGEVAVEEGHGPAALGY